MSWRESGWLMKMCPFCAEEIQDAAVKCRYCGEFLADGRKPKGKWYFATSGVVIALLCAGPLALPLVWFHPRYKTSTKVMVTAIVIAGTAVLCYISVRLYTMLLEPFETMTGGRNQLGSSPNVVSSIQCCLSGYERQATN